MTTVGSISPFSDALQQRPHVTVYMTLAGLDGERSVHQRPERELVDEPAIDADDRDRTAAVVGSSVSYGFPPIDSAFTSMAS